jgi:hypothetical protein
MVPVSNRLRYELDRIVDALNGRLPWESVSGREEASLQELRFSETPMLLRKLVEAWQSSGPDFAKFSREHRKMWADVARYWETGTRLNPLLLVGAPGGGAAIFQNNRPESDPYQEALRLFISLLLNPTCNKLARPCPRCNHYYIPRSAKNKVYCSRSCGTRATALAATKERRAEEHAAKLARALKLGQDWCSAPTNLDWKRYITRRDQQITSKFLTRAVNAGSLSVPTRTKRKGR